MTLTPFPYFPGASATSFSTWSGGFAAFEAERGLHTPKEWRVIAYGTWLLAGNPPGKFEGGAKAVELFQRYDIQAPRAQTIIASALCEDDRAQRDFAELLKHHALQSIELQSSASVLNMLRDDGFTELVRRWREYGRDRKLHTVALRLRREREGEVASPPNDHPLLNPLPSSLGEVLRACLPEETQPVAGQVASALLMMKLRTDKTWSIHKILRYLYGDAADKREEESYQISRALSWLSRRGVVANKSGNYELCRPTSEETLGQQILSMVR